MKYNFKDDVKVFMIFDILGDTERSGPHLWQIDRKRLEDVKNHTLDLLLIVRILKKYLPADLDYDKINDYIMCHDLPEAITGDITKFEGIPKEEIKRVTDLAINYLTERFNDVLDFNTILNDYGNRVDIESKIVRMIDSFHSASTFMKYQSEKNIDMDDPRIIPELEYYSSLGKREGKDIADVFYDFHMASIDITDEECKLYSISREYADSIVDVIRSFAQEMYSQKLDGSLLDVRYSFPKDAMKYNRNKEDN